MQNNNSGTKLVGFTPYFELIKKSDVSWIANNCYKGGH